MTQTTQTTELPGFEDLTVVDCDVHAGVDLSEIANYVDGEPSRSKMRRFAEMAEGSRITLYDRYIDGKIEENSLDTPEEIERVLIENFHVDHPILTPLNAYLDVRNPHRELNAPLMRATNDWLLDRYLDANDAFRLCAPISLREPDKAAEEIDRIADEDQVVGVLLYHTAMMPPMGDPTYDPIYRAAEENDLVVAYHSSTSGLMYSYSHIDKWFSTWFEAGFFAHTVSKLLTMVSLTRHGAFEKFSELEFVFLEAGISWVPHAMFRLNTIYSKRRSEAPLLEKEPEEYIRERCYFGTQPLGEPKNPADMRRTIETVGSDSILFASDYPHWDFDHPTVFDAPPGISSAEIEQVMGGNAIELFGL